MTPQIIGVSEFIGILNETLGFAFPQVAVEGEVSEFRVTQNKWVSFNLKDETSSMNCFMVVHQLKVPLEDGMKIRVIGKPRIYAKTGRFSFSVSAVELAGEGEIRRAYELLKTKLEHEGLFSPERKRSLPRFPRRIGLITSATSAAYADFMKILNVRFGGLTIELAHVQVQGVPAPDQIVEAFAYFNQLSEPVDVVVLIRGGGSLEDLQAFNTEPVARAVAGSRTPTIVGVGHEVDTTLADFAADRRAATPTDAARIVVPDRVEVVAEVTGFERRLAGGLGRGVAERNVRIDRQLARIEAYVRRPLERVSSSVLQLRRGGLLLSHSVTRRGESVDRLVLRLRTQTAQTIEQRDRQLAGLVRLVSNSNPQATLARGYSIARQDGKILRDADATTKGSNVVIQLAKGQLTTKVIDE